MPATIHDHFINKSLLASLDAQAESDPDSHDDYPASPDFLPDSFRQQPKMTAAYSASYSASFTSYPNTTRARHHASQSYRDFYAPHDAFAAQLTSPGPVHGQPYDFAAQQQQPALNGAHKSPYILDPYGAPKPASQQQQPPQSQSYPFANGVVQLASQTPYGPHIPTSANPAASTLTSSVSLAMANGAGPTTTTVNGEEISTIFVVGFPEDMQEREFQNMFTFSPGFEAATLKIPNKEYTAYNPLIAGPPSLNANGPQRNYSASNDPYNLVTVNQGGVLVDNGRDGMSSWPAPPPSNPNDDLAAHYANAAAMGGPGAPSANSSILPPRKQIIGFAKFRSRDEALVARDVLQGRRVDIEKGAVLKAEMAKKNLHTKRGVGPVPGVGPVGSVLGVVPPGGVLGPPGSQSQDGIHTSSSLSHFADSFNTLMNGDGGAPRQRNSLKIASSEGEVFMRGARARAEEDDREREREALMLQARERERERGMSVSSSLGLDSLSLKDKEREREVRLMRLRATNAVAFDAFHGVPAGPSSASSSALMNGAASSGATPISRQSSNASATPSMISSGSISGSGSGLWASPTTIGSDAQSMNHVLEKQNEENDGEDSGNGGDNNDGDHADAAEPSARESLRQGSTESSQGAHDANDARFSEEPNHDNYSLQGHARDAQHRPHHEHEHELDHGADDPVHEIDAHATQRQDAAHAEDAASASTASDRRQSDPRFGYPLGYAAHEHEPPYDEIVAPWDRISAANNSGGLGHGLGAGGGHAGGSGSGSVNGVSPAASYAAVARPSGAATAGSERSTSPVGYLDGQQQLQQQQQHGGYQQQQPTAYMNQYQHLQYHHDLQAQRAAQQQQWPSQYQQHQQQGWPTQQQLQHQHQQQQQQQFQHAQTQQLQQLQHQQQQQWPAQQQQHYRSPQSESSETSAVGSVSGGTEGSGLGPIGYASSASGSTTVRAGLGVNTNVVGSNSNATAVNGIERLDDITYAKAAPSSSATPAAGVNGVVGDSVRGSPLPPSGGSMSSISSTSTSGASVTSTASGGSGGNTSPQLPSPASGSTTSATSARGTVDQNPPINTLYVGNLPTSPPPMGYPNDYLEETLREMFSARPGYRKLCFRHKANGPMCFVEFEDVHHASKALVEMSGNTLRGIVKNGIRLSYSKNPLGVRTPTSAGGSGSSGGPTPLQQQQLMQTLSNHHMYQHQQHGSGSGQGSAQQPLETLQSRLPEDFSGQLLHRLPPTLLRRDSTLSPTTSSAQSYSGSNGAGNGNGNGGGSFFSSPPPRFYTTSPGTNIAFGPSLSSGSASSSSSTQLTGASNAFVPRSAAAINAGAGGMNGSGSPMGGIFGNSVGGYGGLSQAGFSPFGVPFDNGPFGAISSQQHQQQHQQHQQQLNSYMPQHSIPDGQHQQHQQSDD